ncbi:MAG: hypothetical protein OJF60_003403 [Burkholderiaceae bacterium]|nr:MAG: hypothetical protein OJF60_003403 [Burkholderiaceae bacterium]
MKPETIIERLRRAGIRLFLGNDYGLWASNTKALTPAQKRLIRAHCAELVAYLIDAYDQRGPTDQPSRQALRDLLVRLWRAATAHPTQLKGKP